MDLDKTILKTKIYQKLTSFAHFDSFNGLKAPNRVECFAKQLIDSVRRIEYIKTLSVRPINQRCADSNVNTFNPIKAAIWHRNQGNVDEAFWIAFLSTHFGKNRRSAWNLTRTVYHGKGGSNIWSWNNVRDNTEDFKIWLDKNDTKIRMSGSFGNHRKYESINQLGDVVESYIGWVNASGNHKQLIDDSILISGPNSRDLFNQLYKSMDVYRFGRTGKFDFLCTVGKLSLANIEPDNLFLNGATGPVSGVKLLFNNSIDTPIQHQQLEIIELLEQHLGFDFGMQVLEDALCNWQKNPGTYKYFGG